jgi:hypothetical protein
MVIIHGKFGNSQTIKEGLIKRGNTQEKLNGKNNFPLHWDVSPMSDTHDKGNWLKMSVRIRPSQLYCDVAEWS